MVWTLLRLCVTKGSFFSVKELFSCPVEFYLREVLSYNSGRAASFYQAIFEIFGYFSQKWFERNRSLEVRALLL